MSSAVSVYARLVGSVALWGATWVSGRLLARSLDPCCAAFLRFTVASAFLFLLSCRAEGRLPRPPRGSLAGVFLLGLSGVFLYNILFFSGLKDIPAGRAALIVAASPAVMALFSGLAWGERFGPLKVLGVILSFAGVAVVLAGDDPRAVLSQGLRRGDLFILGCVVAWSVYSLAGSRVMRKISPLAAVTWSCFIGTALLFPAALYRGLLQAVPRATWADWGNVVFLGVLATGVAFTWYYQAIKALGPSRAGVFINLVPVFAIVLGALVLAEPVGPALVFGTVLVVGGVYLTNRRVPARDEAPTA